MPASSEEKRAIFHSLQRMIQDGDLLIWDPRTRKLHGSEDIASVSMSGDAIQISLTEHDRDPEGG